MLNTGRLNRALPVVWAAKPDAYIEGAVVSPMRDKGVELLVGIALDALPVWDEGNV
jgi:hypothetical protein